MFFFLLFFSGIGQLQTVSDTLKPASSVAERVVSVSRTDTIKIGMNGTVTDFLQLVPALTTNDLGGSSGLKTVSMRGMGSAHTSIYLDGIKVGNLQSGQSDLGMFDMDNVNAVSVDYARNSIDFTTHQPTRTGGHVKMNAGSFGTWNPSARADVRFKPNLTASANVSYLNSKGDFPFGDGQVRTNNDIRQIRAGTDLFWGFSQTKIWFNDVDRGAPGSVSWPSEDRQKDRNFLVQSSFRKKISDIYSLYASAKYSNDNIYYQSSWGDSRYIQNEFQLNSSNIFRISDRWKASAIAEIQYDKLDSDSYNQARFAAVVSAGATYAGKRFRTDICMDYKGAWDGGRTMENSLSPSADIGFRISKCLEINAFVRRARRTPTFNELYYVGFGNPELKSEDALLSDIGMAFSKNTGLNWDWGLKADFFYYGLKDKIVSAPSDDDPNIWTPYNIGRVNSLGTDFSAKAGFHRKNLLLGLECRWSFISSRDLETGSQIQYVPRNTLIIKADANYYKWYTSLIWNMRSGRYDANGAMSDWNTLDLNLGRNFRYISIFVNLKNIFDTRYELSSGYPMCGRSLTGTILFTI